MDETRRARIDAVEAWAADARAEVDLMEAEMDEGIESLDLDERMYTLQFELKARLRELEELSGGRLGKAHGRRTGARWSRRT